MNKMVEITEAPRRMVPLDSTAYRAMLDANALPLDGRVELIEGVLIEMSPSNSLHGEALFALSGVIASVLPKDVKGSADVAFTLSDTLVLAPDIAIIPKEMNGKNADGAAMLLVIEIADSSLSHDLNTKAPHYAMQGVRDYWVVDLQKRKLHVHRDPSSSGYRAVTALDWSEAITALLLPALTLRLSEVIDP